jgi:HK97 family phage portal protein
VSSFLWPKQRANSLADYGITRSSSRKTGPISKSAAMSASAVWAATMLRAELISTLPIDVFKRLPGSDVLRPMVRPSVLISPDSWGDGQPMSIVEWLAATQLDLDRFGNAFAIITSRDGNNLSRELRLVDARDVTVTGKGGQVTSYRVGDKSYEPRDIWHERQYVESGSPIGLSPIAAGARTLAAHLSALEFSLDWYSRGASPSMIVQNTTKDLEDGESNKIKRRITASMRDGEPAVFGKSWEVQIKNARATDVAFLEMIDHSVVEIARFFRVPARVIDAVVSGQSVTYANLSQDMLHFLVLYLGPVITRRELALSRLVPGDRFVKLNSEAVLRMDPVTRRTLLMAEYLADVKTQDEVRALENLGPMPKSADTDKSLAARAAAAAQFIPTLLAAHNQHPEGA